MSTVDSWIDPEHIANLMDRLSSAPGSDVMKEEEPNPGAARRAGGAAPSEAARLAAEADAAVQLSPVDDGIAFPSLDSLPPAQIPVAEPAVVPTQRDRVRQRLAQIKVQAAKSGLSSESRPEGGVETAAFTSAEPSSLSVAATGRSDAAGGRAVAIEWDGALAGQLKDFSEKVKKRFGCVRVLVSDSNGASLLPEGESEPALLAAMQKLSESWMGCQRELRLKEPGVLSTVLGKGYRMVVISCETEKGLVSLGLVTRDIVSDSEMVRLRAALRSVLEG